MTKEAYMIAIGYHLKLARLKKSLTLREVSKEVGMSSGGISMVENGVHSISLPRIIELARFLGMRKNLFDPNVLFSNEVIAHIYYQKKANRARAKLKSIKKQGCL